MFRSARQGRQSKKITQQTEKKQSTSNTKRIPKKTQEQHEFYDYQDHTQNRGKKLTGNQIDDHRLTGNNDLDQLDSIVDRCHAENEDGFGVVNSDDDESIDSDEADGELQTKKIKVKHHSNNKGAKVRFEESDRSSLGDGSEGETDLDQDDFIDASAMLDIGADSDHAFSDDEDGMEDSDEESDGAEEDDNDVDLDEPGDDEDSRLNSLAKLVDNLNQKRKENSQDPLTDHPDDGPTKRRKLLPAQIESRTEGEILPSMSTGGILDEQSLSGRVNLEDLLSNLSSTPGISELKKSLKPLINKSSSKAGLLSAPLETRRQQQIERQAAYELTKKEMTKWDESTKLAQGLSGRNSDGKNRFVVPSNHLSAADKEPDATRWNMHFNPTNSLESQVVGLIQSSQITSKNLVQEESDQLISQGLSVEQVRGKVLESKMARELMFRAERKAKRVAKIKSKAFRRIRKKEKQRISGNGQGEEGEMEFIQELDDIDGGDRVQSRTEQMEIDRARERASLKHSNQGKWAKKVAGLKGLGGDTNTAIQDRIRREELLKKKIAGQGSDDDDNFDSDSDFDSDIDNGDHDINHIKAHALKQLDRIDSQTGNSQDDIDDSAAPKGLFAMKFMQKAMAVKERKAEEARLELRQQLLEEENGSGDDGEDELMGGMKVQGNPGRLVFNPDVCRQAIGPSTAENDALDQDSSAHHPIPSKTTKTSGSHLRVMALENSSSKGKNTNTISNSKSTHETVEETNPWLAGFNSNDDNGGTLSRIKDLNPNSTTNKNASIDVIAEKAKLKTEKIKRKQNQEKLIAKEDAQVDLDFNSFLGGAEVLKQMQQDNEGNGEDGIIRNGQTDSLGRTAFQQRELVKQAFVDDQVVAQFIEEKSKVVESQAPKEIDVTLPGWGDWVGKGGKKSKHSKKFVKKINGIDPTKRKDYGKDNLIILEQQHPSSTSSSTTNKKKISNNNAKKLSKYQIKDLPFPYTNQNQLELKLNHSIGPEFNTRSIHRHLVRPDTLIKPGVIINPVDKPV
ncbi:hypothetical protein MJO28_010168 [Puccinia striiformis f. sp. tritici]|uniref:Uncharacterized protein n=1 Tax=Puccinia striiformis f. sp. tritici TaxID=168172 RepID=A0ACC0E3U3_9BASI|nr:hypothetical protein MJO28_010168 [Puccinia striiformis f. sp. tritici]